MERKKYVERNSFCVILLVIFFCKISSAALRDCYLSNGRPQRCLPPFENAAYAKVVMATNTCGTPAEEYCVQTGVTGVTRSCHICDSRSPSRSHNTEYLTDVNEGSPTWWQSSTMVSNVQYPNMVNLTLNLNKAFDITYVRVGFHSSRPESFAIYKKKCENCAWQPFQYYSGSCFTTYQIDNKEIVTGDDEQKALCTDDFSDISPLTGGNVAFSTLEGRPGAYNFDRSPVLQDWVKAVAIRITLNRINTFGDEVFNDPKILRSYYYGISDLSVGGRCTCNGHASHCNMDSEGMLQCECEHNTAGRDCERCDDFYNDRPWARGTRYNPGVCQACDCNGMSNTCYFDANLYQRTGHGGHCTNCRGNTDGPKCEFCRQFHYRNSRNECQPCECNAIGSTRQQCDEQGRCTCRPGVGGPGCDQCLEGYYGLTAGGCRACNCDPAGTVEGSVCDFDTGRCVCKMNVEGQHCNRCVYGTMNLQTTNPYGCTACFCFGQSSVCEVAKNYTVAYIASEFDNGVEDWKGEDNSGNSALLGYRNGRIVMTPGIDYLSYFVAPGKFLGVQRFSYNQFLEFELSVEDLGLRDDPGSGLADESIPVAFPSRQDLVLGGAGFRVTASITSQGNPVPNSESQLYRFRLHERAGFYPILSPFNFQKMLNALDTLKIRSVYGERLSGFLDNVQLTSAEKFGSGPPANWVEQCELDGYEGQFTERCAPGYTRDPPNGGVYAPCVLCNCNGHAETCDPESGVCDCIHNTMGDNCELCATGFYFSGDEARRGTPQECQPCPCPDRSACVVVDDGNVVCTNCPPGHAGQRCESCLDGWFGDPLGRGPCLRCMCNGNIDENAIMNCDRITGECLKCIYNTTGSHCERCLDGYFGSPFSKNPEEQCRLCECNPLGSNRISSCNSATGACECLPNVEGRQCERCAIGYWNINSGAGCEACNCHLIGASTGECDQDSGQCICQPGVMGQRCNQCLPNYYGLSRAGCTACECNRDGSKFQQCTETGRCICKDGVYGVKCDQCQENYYNLAYGCIPCPTCYGLVQDAVNEHRSELQGLEDMINRTGELPQDNQNNAQFLRELDELNNTAHALLERGNENKKKWDALSQEYIDYADNLEELLQKLDTLANRISECNLTKQSTSNLNAASQGNVQAIRTGLNNAQSKLNRAMMDLNAAQNIADESLSKENNMSRLAIEAQAIALDHKAQSEYIVKTAQEALDTSKDAKNAIEEAISTVDDLINSLEELIDSENKIPAARKLRDELLAQSGVVKNNTESAKMESTNLLAQADRLQPPVIDTDSLNRKSEDIISDSQALLPNIETLDQQYKDNFGSLQTEADKARDLLDIAEAAQNTADMLLAQAHGALQDAEGALARGNESYHSVLDIIKTLRSFEDEISSSREDANNALANVPEIRRKISEANNLTDETKAALGQAKSVAKQAKDKAEQAKDIANSVKENAVRIRSEADINHNKAAKVSSAVEKLEIALETTERILIQAEDNAAVDKTNVEEATKGANEAKQNAVDSKRQVNRVLSQLQDILDQLNGTEDITDEDLNSLERRYETLQDAVADSNIEDTISQLRKDARDQEAILNRYDSEIQLLINDINLLEDIYQAIPKNCSKQAAVEQP